MDAELLPASAPTWSLRTGWHVAGYIGYQKLANQQAVFEAGCKDGCDWLRA